MAGSFPRLGQAELVPVLVGFLIALDLAWLYLTLGHGRFWWPVPRIAPERPLQKWPSVAVVVPARDEAALVGHTVRGLLGQDYPGEFRVVVVDDRSGDGTGEIAGRAADGSAADLVVVSGQPTPAGWTGKVWALEQGRIQVGSPDYLLLTDADIEHPPHSLRRLVSQAETEDLDMVSLMAKLRVHTPWERLLVPAFVYFFAQLFPFSWVRATGRRTAAAAGGCVLVRRVALERAGAFASVSDAVIDDVSLAGALKSTGSRLWLGFADDVRSVRPYEGLGDLWCMVARSAFTQLRYSPLLLLGTVVGLAFVFLLPVAGVATGLSLGSPLVTGLAAASWVAMALSYAPMLRYYGVRTGGALLLPVTAALYSAMTVDSARRHLLGTGVAWKGQEYRPLGSQPPAT